MSFICPDGHSSATPDYCDQCGVPMIAREEDDDTSPATRQRPCPVCGEPRSGDDRFCERCGHDFTASPLAWEAIVTADRARFDRTARPDLAFPSDFEQRRFAVTGTEVWIGKGRPSGESPPEIDLSGPPEDPCVSRRHAVLLRQGDGTYALKDKRSTNGTFVNDSPVEDDALVPLAEGDRIQIGAWTTITLKTR